MSMNGVFEVMFGKKKTPEQLLREQKRLIDRAVRELERERNSLIAQEKKYAMEVRKAAAAGQHDAAKIMAKSILRSRAGAKKLLMLKSHLQAVSLRLTTLKTTQSMAMAMRSATKAMTVMSQKLNMPQLQRLVMDFERTNEKMDMTQDIMGDALDDAFGEENEEEESDAMVNQIMTELGIDLANQFAAPQAALAVGAPQRVAVAEGGVPAGGAGPAAVGGPGGVDADLLARLNNLRGGGAAPGGGAP